MDPVESGRESDDMLDKVSTWVAIVTSILALVVGGGWYQEYVKGQREEIEARQRLITDTLAPVQSFLESNTAIFKELKTDRYTEPGWGIQESYLIKIRRDGVAKNSLMKQRVDTLVKNNQSMIALLQKYSGYVRTEEFRASSRAFIDHATLYNDRWNSLLEIFQSGGDFPTAAPVFPEQFPSALQAEIAAVRAGA